MEFPPVTLADWRAQVEKELAGRSFEKTLVQESVEGLAIQPLYTEGPTGALLAREVRDAPFRICMRHSGGVAEDLRADLDGGADAIWLGAGATHPPAPPLTEDDVAKAFFVLDVSGAVGADAVAEVAARVPAGAKLRFALNDDPLGRRAFGRADFGALDRDLAALGRNARTLDERFPGATAAMVSTLGYHDAGADAVDELAFALSSGVRTLEALREAGLSADGAARHVAVQVSVGRDTFLELCKVRALRTCWQKLLAAAGAPEAPRTLIHAVCSARTMTVRDPWVNMLRVTTQVYSAVLGGADLVTPNAFDQASGEPSLFGRRVARNTGLVLREESFLGAVEDPAGGSYYLDSLTDALAREAWRRFQALEKDGGIARALESGRIAAALEAAWKGRLEKIAKRKTPILGVSDFANLGETLPRPAPGAADGATPAKTGALVAHRDAESFEALRLRADALPAPPEALLLTLGTLAETRPRAGFAAGFFTAGGIRTREGAADESVPLVCLCGPDERYAADAVARVRALKTAGARRVLLAGRPGALEADLRAAGIDGFIFVGCDAVGILSELLEVAS